MELRPGSPGFEKALRIAYGLAADGLVLKNGMPRNPLHAALVLDIGEGRLPGAYRRDRRRRADARARRRGSRHLGEWWEPGHWCLHSADWWRRHWQRTGVVAVELADTMPEGWRLWLDWQRAAAPHNAPEIVALEADAGRHLGYVRAVARRTGLRVEEPITAIPPRYDKQPLLRDSTH